MADYRDVARAGAELAVVVGIIESAVENNPDTPEEVKENFTQKTNEVVANLERELQEFLEFGEAYDRED